ncbi:oligosaccharide flippase family protein [bacterium]|nr:oligosaccharide flippase family protein [bacterium]
MKSRSPVTAVRWVLAFTFAQRLIGIAGLAIIARLVSEAEWGVYRQVISLHLMVWAALSLGFDQLVVREAEQRERYGRALRGALMLGAAILAIVAWAGHGVIAGWMGLGDSSYLLWFFPLIVFLETLKLNVKPLHVAELNFARIGVAEFSNTAVTLLGGAALVLLWHSVAALYTAYAVAAVVEVAILWRGRSFGTIFQVGAAWREFRALVGKHRRFCSVFTADQLLNASGAQAPVLILGALVGEAAAGVFAMANALIAMPMFLLVHAIGRVAFPALAGLEENELQRRVLLTLRGASATIPIVLLGLAFYAPILVHLILGADWVDSAAPMFKWLALYLVFQGLFSPISSLDVLRDRPEVGLFWNGANLIVRAGALIWGASRGVETAIAALAVCSAAMWLVYGGLLAWLLRAGYTKFFLSWMRFIPLWGLFGLALWGLCALLPDHQIVSFLLAAVPTLLYGAALRFWDRETYDLLMRLGTKFRKT